jgi:hypothetical protein
MNNIPEINSNYTYTSWDEINIDYDTQLIDENTLENSAGVCRINDTNKYEKYFQIRNFIFKLQD